MQRDPRWGRNQEAPGEDPVLTGKYVVAFVQGLQGAAGAGGGPADPKGRVLLDACCKHFLANSLENWEGRYVAGVVDEHYRTRRSRTSLVLWRAGEGEGDGHLFLVRACVCGWGRRGVGGGA